MSDSRGPNVRVGFTGTRVGLTEPQAAALADLLSALEGVEGWHHGGAIGADAEFHALALSLGGPVTVHPCDLANQRADLDGEGVKVLAPRPPLERNRDLVDAV